jgi:hypothetical protein
MPLSCRSSAWYMRSDRSLARDRNNNRRTQTAWKFVVVLGTLAKRQVPAPQSWLVCRHLKPSLPTSRGILVAQNHPAASLLCPAIWALPSAIYDPRLSSNRRRMPRVVLRHVDSGGDAGRAGSLVWWGRYQPLAMTRLRGPRRTL